MMETERTVINLRGYCLFCLGKLNPSNDSQHSPTSSPLSTPLRGPYVHSLPLEDRLAPFTDICRYLNVDIPDCYAFGDGMESTTLTPPLCEKCKSLSTRLCALQDELQYLQTRIGNTVKRIRQRVAATCDHRRAVKRDAFEKEFRRKSKGSLSLSRGRAECPELRKVTKLIKMFQMRIIEQEPESVDRQKQPRRNTTFISGSYRNPEPPPDLQLEMEFIEPEADQSNNEIGILNTAICEDENGIELDMNGEVWVEDDKEEEDDRYLPLEETLRTKVQDDAVFEGGDDEIRHEVTQPGSELTTLLCSLSEDKNVERESEVNENHLLKVENNETGKMFYVNESSRVITRAQARKRLFLHDKFNYENKHNVSRNIKRKKLQACAVGTKL